MPKLAEISFRSVSITLNYMNNNVMFQFISVCLRYLVHVLVRSAMNQYRFFLYSFSFLEYFSSSFSFSKQIAIISVLVFVLVMKIALIDPWPGFQGRYIFRH